jgi:DNA-binding NtrC family response regulator
MILLVDDEEQIIIIMKTMLKALGFKVIETSNGREALELYQKNSADIRLVITDLCMPIMDGYELFGELKKIRPDLPIIISSGCGDATVTSRIPRENIAGLLSKPYNFEHLREVLMGVLECRKGSDFIPHQILRYHSGLQSFRDHSIVTKRSPIFPDSGTFCYEGG